MHADFESMLGLSESRCKEGLFDGYAPVQLEVFSPACLAFQPKAHRLANLEHQEALACTQSQKRQDRGITNIVACSQAKHEQQVLYSMCWSSFICEINVVSSFPK